jgi:hypothetical protein
MTTEDAVRTSWYRPLVIITGVLVGLTVLTGVGLLVDHRVLTGAPIWLKPFKFAISSGIYSFTFAWILSVLPGRHRVIAWAATVAAGAAALETVIIAAQAARGTMSHYNESTPLNATIWQVMAKLIMVLFAAHLLIAIGALRWRIADRAAAYALRLGLGLSVLGMLAAVPMVTPLQDPGVEGITGAHSVGVPDGGPGLPLTGWSTTGGDLRIGHFVGLHGLQSMPLLAYLLARFGGRRLDVTTRARLLLVAGCAYGVLVGLLTWQALRAQPLLRPDALMLVALAALAGTTVVAALAVVARGRRPELALAA